MEAKPFYSSITLWTNLLMAVGIFTQSQFGITLSPEMQGMIITGVNVLLRLITKKAVTLK